MMIASIHPRFKSRTPWTQSDALLLLQPA